MNPDLQLEVATTALSNASVTRLTNLRQFQQQRLALVAEAVQGILRLKTAAEALLAGKQVPRRRRQHIARLIRSRLADIDALETLFPRRAAGGSNLADHGLGSDTLRELADHLCATPPRRSAAP